MNLSSVYNKYCIQISITPKGISAVIAVILLLITIAIVGFAYTFFFRTVEATGNTTQQQLGQQTQQIGTLFSIESVDKNKVYVRNRGATPLTGLAFYVNNVNVNYAGLAALNASQLGTYFLNDSQLAMLPDPAQLRVTSAGASEQITADFYGRYTVGYWKFDEGGGTVALDSSGNGNTGSLYNGTTICSNPPTVGCSTWIAGRYGNALQFNGIDNYVNVGNVLSFERTDSFSYSAWFKTNALRGDAILAKMDGNSGTYRGYDLFMPDSLNGAVRVHLINTWPSNAIAVDTVTKWNDGNWHHVMATYDGSSAAAGVKIYVDGVLQPLTSPPAADSLSATIVNYQPLGR